GVGGADRVTNEHLKSTTSTYGGGSWTDPINIEVPGDRPYYTAPALSPDGSDAYVVYNAFRQPYQATTSTSRPLIGVLLHADVDTATGAVGTFSELFSTRANSGDARAASANNGPVEFLGDYVYAIAQDDYRAAVWNGT